MIKRLLQQIANWFKSLLSKGSKPQLPSATESLPDTDHTVPQLPSEQKTYEVKLRWGKVKLPAKGRFVTESHYLTEEDWQLLGRYPKKQTEFVDNHMDYSLKLLAERGLIKMEDMKKLSHVIYNDPWDREYTPSEGGGNIGGAARKPFNNAWDEMWAANMLFSDIKSIPVGSKFKLTFNGKSVIVNMGLEVGPLDKKYLGGCSPETHYFLGSTSKDDILLEKVSDHLNCGPLL